MSRSHPEAGCDEIAFDGAYPLDEGAEVALEDYARALFRSRGAEALRSPEAPARVSGVHLCGAGAPVTGPLRRDLEDFARSLVTGTGGGLGWS
jgi:hypothetical protein